jgi:putative tributyrin esterase
MKRICIIFLLFFSNFSLPQIQLLFDSDYIPYTDTTLIFIPESYDGEESFPLLFMLHGWSGNYEQWNSIIPLQEYADEYNFIIVCPDGFYDSWYVDSPINDSSQFETFLFEDLVPKLFTDFKIDTNNIFITGLSMGGHGAVTLHLKYPNFFKASASTSGILDLTHFPEKWGMKNIFGDIHNNYDTWIEHSAYYLLKDDCKNIRLHIDCGTEDFAYEVNKNFSDRAQKLDINLKFVSGPGNHSHEYWKSSIPAHFIFFKEMVNKKD